MCHMIGFSQSDSLYIMSRYHQSLNSTAAEAVSAIHIYTIKTAANTCMLNNGALKYCMQGMIHAAYTIHRQTHIYTHIYPL